MTESHPSSLPRPWKLLDSEEGPDLLIAQARFDRLENPRTGKALKRLVLRARDWVNVVALTPERRLVVVHQYRFGSATVTTEIPGGVIDPGEEPLQTARRELREETGYTAARWTLLAEIDPNPAFLRNRCFQFLAEDARPTHDVELDPGEDITVETLDLDDVRQRVDSGGIRHSLVLCALARVLDLRR